MGEATKELAMNGGPRVASEPFPSALLGPGDIGDAEIEAVTAVLRRGKVFRFDDPDAAIALLAKNGRNVLTSVGLFQQS